MLNLEAALRGAVSASIEQITGSNRPATKVDADAVLARLNLAGELYERASPFRVGDLITPRSDANMKGAGEPCVVIEDLREPVVLRDPTTKMEHTISQMFGRKLDLRYSRILEGAAVSFLAESQDFEAWTPEHDAAWRAKLAAAAAAPQPLTLAEAISALRDRAAGTEVKAEWKEGDTVEIVPEPRGAEAPMNVEGSYVGIVRKVDQSDGTTHVTYHAASTGKIGNAWLRNSDLRKWGPKPVETTESATA